MARRVLLRVTFYGCVFAIVFSLVVSLQWKISKPDWSGTYPVSHITQEPTGSAAQDLQKPVHTNQLGDEGAEASAFPADILVDEKDKCNVQLPYRYPVHSQLPAAATLEQASKGATNVGATMPSKCGTSMEPIFGAAPQLATVNDPTALTALKKEFGFEATSNDVFYSPTDPRRPLQQWWAFGDDRQLPCTAEVQQRIYNLQHPADCKTTNFLVSKLKEGAHGVGSAITLVAHDLLSAIVLKRVLAVRASPRWFFASQHCAARSGLDCYFLPPTHCAEAGHEEKVSSKSQALRSSSRFVRKSSFDIKGLGRNNVPSDEEFFGPTIMASSCFASYKTWTGDARNTYLQGTFERGADPRLFYMLAQAVKYLMREPQPWFRSMLAYHLPKIGVGNILNDRRLVYVQDRGEIAKYREYYNTFGCHTIRSTMLSDFALTIAGNWQKVSDEKVAVFISGNTPNAVFLELEKIFNDSSISVSSTWRHPDLGTAESSRWGASSPASSWIDLYAGVASSSWVCIVQSNWCRMINFLRLTSSRASCNFVDVGVVMLADGIARRKYCVVNSEWPTKPFSNVLQKHPKLPNLPVC